MSKATKRKHVTKEVMDEFALPDGDRIIVKVMSGRGNNLHEVESPSGEVFLVSMPTKFRKNIWIKRGDFVMVEPIDEGDKVKAEISHILYKEQIKYIKEEKLWPVRFEEEDKSASAKNVMIPDDMLPPSDDEDEYDEDEDEDIREHSPTIANPNRRVFLRHNSDCESDDETDDDNDDDNH